VFYGVHSCLEYRCTVYIVKAMTKRKIANPRKQLKQRSCGKQEEVRAQRTRAGLEAFIMRRLAKVLRVVPMAYKHVEKQGGALDGMGGKPRSMQRERS